MKLVTIDMLGSSPVYDPEILKAARDCVAPPRAREVSLQKLDGTEVYEWHYRNDHIWHGDGKPMVIDLSDRPVAEKEV